MNKALKGKTSRLLVCALLCVALIFGVFASVSSALISAYADDEEQTVQLFTTQELTVSNSQFSESSGSFPKSPSSWTGGGIDGKGSSGVIGGVMDIETYAANKDKYELATFYPDDFPGNTSPKTPFGEANYPGTNKKVLLINVRPVNGSSGTAYGYTSSTLTFTANRYYMVSAWVRTGDFEDGMGAAIRLNGLNDDVGFTEINTVRGITPDKSNYYGWEEFTFYIATSSLTDRTATISLQVGDSYTDSLDENNSYYHPASGYAMFDNIHAYQISPEDFLYAQQTLHESDHAIFRDYSNKTGEQFAHVRNLDFTSGIGNSDWTPVLGDGTDFDKVNIGIYNGSADFDADNRYHLTSDPLSSYGKPTLCEGSVLVISSYTNGKFNSVAAGVSSEKFTLERYRYYRISAWVKTQEMSDDGNGATLALSVIRNQNQDEYKGQNLLATVTSCEGDNDAVARGTYKQYSLYVKGSSLKDYEASVECRLGTEGNESSGIAIFDNVTIEEITPDDFTAYSGNGTIVTLDTDSGVEENYISFDDTGITNGEFYNIDAYHEFEYPFSPSGWTMFTPSTALTTGYSTEESFLDLDHLTYGTIPSDQATFDKYAYNFGGAYNYGDGTRNILLMGSPNLTAFCYRSPDFSLSSGSPAVVTVEMLTENIKGYGASLVLKDGSNVIATIEQIQSTQGFKTYSFYLDPDTESPSTLRVEIWLGNSDRKQNSTKRASGRIYVQKVSLTTLTDDTDGDTAAVKFDKAQKAYEQAMHNGNTIGQAAYSYKANNFGAYDYYDDQYVKRPYNWKLTVNGGDSANVHYGIFDPNSRTDNDGIVPSTFKNEQTPENNSILMLYNSVPAASSITSSSTMVLSADTYYQLDVWLKVDIPEQESANAVGVSLSLSGTDFAFKNIVDTSLTIDGNVNTEYFRKYTFYISPGSEEADVALVISLGDASSSTKWCSGRVYISSISVTDINTSLFNEQVNDIEENGNDDYALVARLNEKTADSGEDDGTTDNETGDNGISWWLIPSILFAVAILAAIIGFSVRKIVEWKKSKKGVVQGKATYDRTATLNPTHNKKAAKKEEKVSTVADTASDESYESFDDDAENAETEQATQEAEQAPATEETATEPTPETTEEAPATEEKAPATEEKPAEEPAKASPAPASNDIDRFDD